MFQRGLWTIGHWKNVPIRLHWSIPLGALFFSRFEFAPGFWLGFVLLILFHELGHAALAKARRLHIFEVQVHGLGGVCVHESGTPYDNSIVAWGGVLAQALFLVPAFVIGQLGVVRSAFVAELVWVFTETNLFLIALNLIPIEPFDGAKAWRLPKLWWQRRGRRRPSKKKTKPRPPSGTEDPVALARKLAQDALDDARRH
ncbi:MAG: hypothetical protein AAGE52_31010 [Myxococcota bacterium]